MTGQRQSIRRNVRSEFGSPHMTRPQSHHSLLPSPRDRQPVLHTTRNSPPEFSRIRQTAPQTARFLTPPIRQKMRSEFGSPHISITGPVPACVDPQRLPTRRVFPQGQDRQGLCSFAPSPIAGNRSTATGQQWQARPMPCFNRQDGEDG
jgi:hypothetical protein